MEEKQSSYSDIATDIAGYAAEAGGDVMRHIIAPAMLDVLGPLGGKEVLDIYCGAGYISRRLASLGASVTAVDNSERLIGIARHIQDSEGGNIRYAVTDTSDLSAIDDRAFDCIVCNMGLMMMRELSGTVAELARLVKMGGRFVFSVLHPCYSTPDSTWVNQEDVKSCYKTVGNYFGEGWWTSELAGQMRSGLGKVKHRTISHYITALGARGFTVRRLVEPVPSHEAVAINPHLEMYNRIPAVIIVEAVFPYI